MRSSLAITAMLRGALFIASLGIVMGSARADGAALKDSVPHVAVTGAAEREVVPDRATIFLGVKTERPTADAALTETARAAKAVIADLQAQGVDAKDIRTTHLDLSTVYDEAPAQPGVPPKRILRGYNAQDLFSVRIKDVGKAGALARRAFDHGANSFSGIAFSTSAAKQIEGELRGEAARDARTQAESYARALGLTLGRVLEIGTSGGRTFQRMMPMVMAKSPGPNHAAEPDIPLAPGTLTLNAGVSVIWELKAP